MPKPKSKVKKYRYAMLIIPILIIPTIVNALNIDAQSTSICGLQNCHTCVDLSKWLNTAQINNLKTLNLTSKLPSRTGNLTDIQYNFTGTSICIYGRIKPATSGYWVMDLNGVAVIDPWWNSTFTKCKNITVSNPKAGHPSFINITFDSDMQSDFDDIRFLNTYCGNSGTELSHFIRNYTASAWASYDLKLDSTTTVISMYYGNPSSSSASSISGVWGNNLTGYWTFDDGAGVISADISGNDLDCNVSAPSWKTSGVKSNYLNFSATGTVIVNCPDSALLEPNNSYTIMAWAKRYGATPQYTRFVEKFLSTNNPYLSYALQIYENPGTANEPCSDASSGSALTRVRFSSQMDDMTWEHLVSVYNTTHIVNYMAGVQDGIAVYASAINYSGSTNLTIGNRLGSANQYTGSIDEVLFFRRGITPTEVANFWAETEPTFSFASEEAFSIPTDVDLWINNAQANITTACSGTNHNYTASINVTSLPVSIMYNGTIANTSNTTVSWYGALISGLWNFTANYTGNATYSGSSTWLWHNITKGTANANLTFNNLSNSTVCINSLVIVWGNSTELEEGVLLYLNGSNVSNPYNTTPRSEGVYNFTLNWTSGDCYDAGSLLVNMTAVDCSVPASTNITEGCCPITTIFCGDNSTLYEKWNTSDGISYAYKDCVYGCDNVTMVCRSPVYQENLIIFTIIIIIGIVIYLVFLR